MPWEGDVVAGDSGSPYAQGNTVQKRDATLSGGRPGSRSWAKMDIKEARAAPGSERASPLRRGSPGPDSGPLGWPLFPPPAWPGQRPLPSCAKTRPFEIAHKSAT